MSILLFWMCNYRASPLEVFFFSKECLDLIVLTASRRGKVYRQTRQEAAANIYENKQGLYKLPSSLPITSRVFHLGQWEGSSINEVKSIPGAGRRTVHIECKTKGKSRN